jgi:hypothetical protein
MDSAKKTPKVFFSINVETEKLDLIVIFTPWDSTAVKESYLARTPVITLSKQLYFSLKTGYDSVGQL